MARRVRLLVPGLLGPLPEGTELGLPQLPALETLLARGRRVPVPDGGLEALIHAQFAPDMIAQPAPGAIALFGDRGEPGDGYWLRADPVHLEADRDRVMLLLGDLALTQAEADELVEAFNRFFGDDGLELVAPTPMRWYLRMEKVPQVQTWPTDRVSGRYIDAYLPSGPDATAFTRLLNEIQMFLHASPVNSARRAAGQTTVNGLWLWGGGHLPRDNKWDCRWTSVLAEHPSARGWARLCGLNAERADLRAAQGEQVLAVVESAWAALMSGNLASWEQALIEIENEWCQPLLAALRSGTLAEIELLSDKAGWRLGRRALRRFWRRRRALEHWLQ